MCRWYVTPPYCDIRPININNAIKLIFFSSKEEHLSAIGSSVSYDYVIISNLDEAFIIFTFPINFEIDIFDQMLRYLKIQTEERFQSYFYLQKKYRCIYIYKKNKNIFEKSRTNESTSVRYKMSQFVK